MRRKLIGLFILMTTSVVLYANTFIKNQFDWPMYDYYIKNALLETGSENVVTAIYLNYRYYDTLFEALMLLFSIIAVIYMSIHEEGAYYE